MTEVSLPDEWHSQAYDINNRGQVVGYSVFTDDYECVAFVWEDGELTQIEDPTGGGPYSCAIAWGVNNRTQVVGLTNSIVTEPLDAEAVSVDVATSVRLLAGVALALPGVLEVRTSAAWWNPKVPRSGGWATLGMWDDERWDAAVERAAAEVSERFGVNHTPGKPLPREIPVRAWEQAIRKHLPT